MLKRKLILQLFCSWSPELFDFSFWRGCKKELIGLVQLHWEYHCFMRLSVILFKLKVQAVKFFEASVFITNKKSFIFLVRQDACNSPSHRIFLVVLEFVWINIQQFGTSVSGACDQVLGLLVGALLIFCWILAGDLIVDL